MLATFVLAILSTVPTPQGAPGPKLMRYKKPLEMVTLDLMTGALERGPRVVPQAVTTTTDLPNLDLGGFIGVDTGGGFCEWIDTAVKGSGAQGKGPVPSDLVSNFVFAYCSAALDTSSGGTGGTMRWTFYPSHATGAPRPASSSQVGSFLLTGLPANTSHCHFSPYCIRCYFIDIRLGSTPLPFADGQVGYGWTFEDLAAGNPPYAATFPFLSCVQSCSGPGPDALGMDDYIDKYCPAGVSGSPPRSTFTFGTTTFGGYFTSINLDMRELDVASTSRTHDGSLPGSLANPDRLQASPVVIGRDWTATVTPQAARAGTPGFDVAVVLVTDEGAPGTAIVVDLAPILVGGGSAPPSELLVTGSPLGSVLAVLHGPGVPSTPATIPIPLNADLLCIDWHAQAIVFGDVTTDGVFDLDPMFTNAAEGLVGSQ